MKVHETMIDVPGGRIWAGIYGSDRPGIPLLVVHGGPGAPHDYLESLAVLSDERAVIFYDQLGCGNSERPEDCALWTLERAVEELSVVRSTLKLERVHLLGQSWGALLATTYLIQRSQSGVAGVTLSAPLLSAPRWMEDQHDWMLLMPDEMQKSVADAERTGDFDAPAYQAAIQAYYQRHLCRLDPWPDCLNRTFEKMGMDVYLTMWGPSEFTATGNLRDTDISSRLGKISIPVLITCGRYDETSPDTASWYQQLIPGARMEVFENASHMHHFECQEQYLKSVQEFMAGAEKSMGFVGETTYEHSFFGL